MLLAGDYAPPRAIAGVIVIGAPLAGLGVALYVRPQIGWTLARYRMSRASIAEAKRERGDTSERAFRVVGLVMVRGGLAAIGVGIGYAVT